MKLFKTVVNVINKTIQATIERFLLINNFGLNILLG